MDRIQTFNDLLGRCKQMNLKSRLAVAAADDEHTLEAVMKAHKHEIVTPVLVGDSPKIEAALADLGFSAADFTVYHAPDNTAAARLAVSLVRSGEADFLMKGSCPTAVLLKAVVDKENGLSNNRLMTHCAIVEIPDLGRLIAVTDGGMVPYPDLQDKKSIIENAVAVFHGFGNPEPKVGILASIESVNPKMPETIEAAELADMYAKGEIKGCIVAGPISYDVAMDPDIAIYKGYEGPVKGDADILVAPDIHAGNILAKALYCSAKAKVAGFVVGAKVPVVVSSRGASADDKFFSILASVASLG
jgi:phosphate butyryltransferase